MSIFKKLAFGLMMATWAANSVLAPTTTTTLAQAVGYFETALDVIRAQAEIAKADGSDAEKSYLAAVEAKDALKHAQGWVQEAMRLVQERSAEEVEAGNVDGGINEKIAAIPGEIAQAKRAVALAIMTAMRKVNPVTRPPATSGAIQKGNLLDKKERECISNLYDTIIPRLVEQSKIWMLAQEALALVDGDVLLSDIDLAQNCIKEHLNSLLTVLNKEWYKELMNEIKGEVSSGTGIIYSGVVAPDRFLKKFREYCEKLLETSKDGVFFKKVSADNVRAIRLAKMQAYSSLARFLELLSNLGLCDFILDWKNSLITNSDDKDLDVFATSSAGRCSGQQNGDTSGGGYESRMRTPSSYAPVPAASIPAVPSASILTSASKPEVGEIVAMVAKIGVPTVVIIAIYKALCKWLSGDDEEEKKEPRPRRKR